MLTGALAPVSIYRSDKFQGVSGPPTDSAKLSQDDDVIFGRLYEMTASELNKPTNRNVSGNFQQ